MKTIDVMEGDTWTIRTNTGELIQYRNGQRILYVCPRVAEQPIRTQPTDDEVPIVCWAVENIVNGWGYTLTRSDDAKPATVEFNFGKEGTYRIEYPTEYDARRAAAAGNGAARVVDDAKPADVPHHFKCPQCEFVCRTLDDEGWRSMCGCRHKDALVQVEGEMPKSDRKPAPTPPAVKENLTTDVPLVDVVWVEVNYGSGSQSLSAYATEAAARAAWYGQLANGTARIVRIRSDAVDDDSIKNISDVLYRLDKQVQALESRLASTTDELAQWIKRVETNAELAETRLGTRLAALESRVAFVERIAKCESILIPAANKPTQTGVVKVPKFPYQVSSHDYRQGWDDAIGAAKFALTAAGVKFADDNHKEDA